MRDQAGALLLLLGALSYGPAIAGDCPTTTTSAEVGAHANAAAVAFFETSDREAFQSSLSAVQEGIPCLGEPIAREDAAQVHLAGALEAVTQQRDDDVVRALRAAVNADPGFSLSDAQAPEGSPLRLALDEARRPSTGAVGQLDAPACVSLVVDGQASTIWSADRPAILQPLGPDGDLLWSRLVAAGERPPTVTVSCPNDLASRSAPRERSSPVAKALLGGGTVVAAGAAGAFWWRAAAAKGQFDAFADAVEANDFDTLNALDSDYPEQLQGRANAFSTAAIGAGVVAAGLGTALVITW
ncbi:MAG: hypothetical protein H6739_37895 [Alphaproteobacteria bacterium]|nr:hypothetical protein [Alphaproteobacteria bacterium]